jgi:restriction endonuclease Mrr
MSAADRAAVQGFVGSMDYVWAKKGVILTTSSFTRDAVDYIERIKGKKVVLIDGLVRPLVDSGDDSLANTAYETLCRLTDSLLVPPNWGGL